MAKKDALGGFVNSLPDGLFLTVLKRNRPRTDAALSFLKGVSSGKSGTARRASVVPRRVKKTKGRRPVKE